MTDLARLIEKLEAASEGSRELDYEIGRHLGLPELEWDDGQPTYGPFDESPRLLPKWSTSLDTALSLVPDGWGFKMEVNQGYGIEVTVGHVGVNKFYDMPHAWSDGPTAPLALCIAALRARMNSGN